MNNEPAYTFAEVDVALCIFDDFISSLISASTKRRNNNDATLKVEPAKLTAFELVIEEIQGYGGTPALRELAIEIAKPIEQIWVELGSKYFNSAFDFEFIPPLLAFAVENNFLKSTLPVDWMRACVHVLETHEASDYTLLKEIQSTSPLLGTLREYRATWYVDVTAHSFQDAAKQALAYQRKLDSTATVFDVCEIRNGEPVSCTLEIDAAPEEQPLDEPWDAADLRAAEALETGDAVTITADNLVHKLPDCPIHESVDELVEVDEIHITDLPTGGIVSEPDDFANPHHGHAEYIIPTGEYGRLSDMTKERIQKAFAKRTMMNDTGRFLRADISAPVGGSDPMCELTVARVAKETGELIDTHRKAEILRIDMANTKRFLRASTDTHKQKVAADMALRHAAIAINATHAAEAMQCMIDAIGEKFIHELQDVGDIDLRKAIGQLRLIAHVWSDALATPAPENLGVEVD